MTRSQSQPSSTDASVRGAASADVGVPLVLVIGAALALVAVLVCLVLLVPMLLRSWRRRRRTGGGADGPAEPMRERTNKYRWYEDAEAVAGDIEARGAASRRVHSSGSSNVGAAVMPLLLVPTSDPHLVGPVARAVEAPLMPVEDLVSGSSSVSTEAHPVNPLLGRCTLQT